MEKGLKIVGYTIMKIFNILIGLPLVFAGTLVVLSICLVDLILLLLPVFLVLNVVLKDICVIVVPNSLGLQLVFTILGTLMGYYLQRTLKVYIPKWFKGVKVYIIRSVTFHY